MTGQPIDPKDEVQRQLSVHEVDTTDPGLKAAPSRVRFKWPAVITLPVLISGCALLFTAVNAYFALVYVRDDLQVMYSESPEIDSGGAAGDDENPFVDLWGAPQFVLINAGSRSIVVSRITMNLGEGCEYDENVSFRLIEQPIVVKAGEVYPVRVGALKSARFSAWGQQGRVGPATNRFKEGEKLDVCFTFRVITTDGIKDRTIQKDEPLVVRVNDGGMKISANEDEYKKPPISIYRSRWPL